MVRIWVWNNVTNELVLLTNYNDTCTLMADSYYEKEPYMYKRRVIIQKWQQTLFVSINVSKQNLGPVGWQNFLFTFFTVQPLVNYKCKASFTLSRCTPRCVPAVYRRRTGANRDESGRNSSAFIYSRQCYGPGPVWGTNLSRYVPVMLRFATVHSRCRSGGATVCPGVSRYTTVLPRESAAEPRCHCGGSRK